MTKTQALNIKAGDKVRALRNARNLHGETYTVVKVILTSDDPYDKTPLFVLDNRETWTHLLLAEVKPTDSGGEVLNRTQVALTLTVTVTGTTAEDLLQHVECIEEEIAGLFEENLEHSATLERYTVTKEVK